MSENVIVCCTPITSYEEGVKLLKTNGPDTIGFANLDMAGEMFEIRKGGQMQEVVEVTEGGSNLQLA